MKKCKWSNTKINVSIADYHALVHPVNTKTSQCSDVINAVTTQGIDTNKKIIVKIALNGS